jgi:diketogulonate reductase-like aldo/keto reductase
MVIQVRETDRQLSDGNSIPQLGLGVYEMSEKETYESVKWALQAGYKHIDTAEWYVSLSIIWLELMSKVRE